MEFQVVREEVGVKRNVRKGVSMTIREQLELWEKEYLSPYATLSMNSKGRQREEDQCDIRRGKERQDKKRELDSLTFYFVDDWGVGSPYLL